MPKRSNFSHKTSRSQHRRKYSPRPRCRPHKTIPHHCRTQDHFQNYSDQRRRKTPETAFFQPVNILIKEMKAASVVAVAIPHGRTVISSSEKLELANNTTTLYLTGVWYRKRAKNWASWRLTITYTGSPIAYATTRLRRHSRLQSAEFAVLKQNIDNRFGQDNQSNRGGN